MATFVPICRLNGPVISAGDGVTLAILAIQLHKAWIGDVCFDALISLGLKPSNSNFFHYQHVTKLALLTTGPVNS